MAFGLPGEYVLIADGEVTPQDRAYVKKLLGRLNDAVKAGGAATQSIKQTGPDGTRYVVEVGPGIKRAYVERPIPGSKEPKVCKCLQGKLSAPTSIVYPGSSGPTDGAFSLTVPFVYEDEIYFLQPINEGSTQGGNNVLYKFDQKTYTFSQVAGNYTTPDWPSNNGPAFAYKPKGGVPRFVVPILNAWNTFYEFEIGGGEVDHYLADNSALASCFLPSTAAGAAAPLIRSGCALDNSIKGQWQESSVVATANTSQGSSAMYVSTYDYLKRKWSAPVFYAAPDDTPGAVGLFDNTAYIMSALNGSNVAQPVFRRIPLNGKPASSASLAFAQYPYGRAYAQLCCCVVLVGGIVDDTGSGDAPNYWDTSDIWHVNLQTGEAKKIGNAPWAGDPTNSDWLTMLVPLSDKMYLFSSTVTPATPNTYGDYTVSVIT